MINWKLHLQVELRPSDAESKQFDNIFLLPGPYIMPTANEAFQGVLVVANRVKTGPF